MYSVTHIINALSFGSPHFASLLLAFGLANAIGLLEYIWAVVLTVREKKGPFPVWMHTFFLAHDSTAAVVFTWLAFKYNFFWLFVVYGIGMYTWTVMEIYCLIMGIKYARQEDWGNKNSGPISVKYATQQVIIQTLVMYCIINVLRYLMQDTAMFLWLPLTNFVMAIGPGYVLNTRRDREGSSVLVYIFIVIGTIINFAPQGIGFFTSILPSVFNQPIWFSVGVVALIVAVINLVRVVGLPGKKQNPQSKHKPVW